MIFSKSFRTKLFQACLILGIFGFAPAVAFPQDHQFIHPGIQWTLDDFDRLAERTGVSPWSDGWNRMRNTNEASSDYDMQGPFALVENKGANQRQHTADAQAALYNAVQFAVTGNEAHARVATDIVDAWATTHVDWGGPSVHLHAAWRGGMMVRAAEILRYTYEDWTEENTRHCEDYFTGVLLPVLRPNNPLRAANQGANNLWGMVQVAIFTNDQELFEECLDAYLNDPCAGISNSLPNGQCGDTGRDQGHAAAMIGNLSATAQIFFTQGIDVYGVLDNRLLKMSEYWCKYNLGEDVEFTDHGTCYGYYTSIGADGRRSNYGDFASFYENVRSNYGVRMGINLPFTLQYIANIDPQIDTFFNHKDGSFSDPSVPSREPFTPFTLQDVTSLSSTDIGSPRSEGESNFSDGKWTLDGSGRGFDAGSNTGYHFAYTQLSGDGEMIAKVGSLDNTNTDANAALVLRTSLTDNRSDAANIYARPTEGSQFSSRGIDAGDGDGDQTFPLSNLQDGDVWLRLERRGNRVVGYVGPDGVTWAPMQHVIFDDLPDAVFIGLASTNRDNGSTLASAVFSNVQISTQPELVVEDSYADENDPPTVSTNDLAQTALLNSSALNADNHARLIDGSLDGTVRLDSDSVLTINLDTNSQPQGYDISEINSVFGWNTQEDGRSNQGYSIRFDLVDGSSRSVAAEHWAPNDPAFFWTTVNFTEASGGMIATGVKSVTFSIANRARAGTFVVAREFDVIGSPSGQSGVVLGDFDSDGVVSLTDLNQYIGNIGAVATGILEPLDLNNDGTVGEDDFAQHYGTLVETSNGQKGTFSGDVDLDGTVSVVGDAFVMVANLNNAVSSWSQGDVSGDGLVSVVDDAFKLVANLGNSNDE